MKNHYFYSSTNSLFDKILLLSLWTECSWPIGLHDSLKCNTSRKKQAIKLVFHIVFHFSSISRKKGGVKLIYCM